MSECPRRKYEGSWFGGSWKAGLGLIAPDLVTRIVTLRQATGEAEGVCRDSVCLTNNKA